ncbi:hypothetical protein IV417_15720 [Alphaproteobacteria bacterium KMM 3653]|uniref:Uncharacterized protein n=1 Tax=Harenicola maris TaxID=2841044 RepID=A0AAP2CQU2_9RHOB|nr:hypothetical protein [Harenicola maris]
MKTTFAIAALATLITAPAFAGGTTADAWFKSQLEADNNHAVLMQVEKGSTAVIGTRGSSNALNVTAAAAAEGNDQHTVNAIANGDITGVYTTGEAKVFPYDVTD